MWSYSSSSSYDKAKHIVQVDEKIVAVFIQFPKKGYVDIS
jgi:hypothetical protein